MIGFAIDPVLYFLGYGVAALQDAQLPGDFLMRLPFQWANLGATIVSAAVWGAARPPSLLSSSLLFSLSSLFPFSVRPPSSPLLLSLNIVPVRAEFIADGVIQGAFSVVLAYMGARVVYGLGRRSPRHGSWGAISWRGK